jgi:hypothetical protein
VLRRVLNLECLRPVPVGTVIEIEGAVLHRAQAYLLTGLVGTPLKPGEGPWLEALLGFAQVDEAGRPDGLPEGAGPAGVPDSDAWRRLDERLHKPLHLRWLTPTIPRHLAARVTLSPGRRRGTYPTPRSLPA